MPSWPKIARRIRVPMSFAFAALYIWLARPTAMSMLIGSALVIPGIMVRALASGHVQKNEQLATSGPYAYTRNPLYLGSMILGAGFAVAARSWWAAGIMIVIFFSIYVPVIGGEETFLRNRFPEFDAYAKAVPRLLPRLSAFGDNRGAFSSELYWKHREYNALVGAIAMMAALVAKYCWTR